MPGNIKDYKISKSMRLPNELHEKLVSEAFRMGLSKVSTLARMIILDRLSKSSLDSLVKADRILKITADKDSARITIHMTTDNWITLEKAAQTVTQSNISRLCQIILLEHYKRSMQPTWDKFKARTVEERSKTITHNCPSCGVRRKTELPINLNSKQTTCRACRAKYTLNRLTKPTLNS